MRICASGTTVSATRTPDASPTVADPGFSCSPGAGDVGGATDSPLRAEVASMRIVMRILEAVIVAAVIMAGLVVLITADTATSSLLGLGLLVLVVIYHLTRLVEGQRQQTALLLLLAENDG